MKDGKLGVAIHGAGWVAAAHVRSWMNNPHVRIVSISSRRPESARRLAREFALEVRIHESYQDVLDDGEVDILNISGPNHVHAEQGIAAARAGKHLLMEKPMSLSLAETRELTRAVSQAKVRSVVGFVLRWNPLFENLKAILAAGAVGDVFYAEVDYWHGIGEWYTGWEWVRSRESGRSVFLAAGCHAIDALRWFTADEVAEVSAFSNNARGRTEFDANVVAILKFRRGAIGKSCAMFDCQMPYAFNIDLLGTEGSLRENRIWSKRLFPGQTAWATAPTTLPDSGDVSHHAFDGQINALVDAIRSGEESHCNIADAYYTHEVCLAIDRALETGQTVKLPLEVAT